MPAKEVHATSDEMLNFGDFVHKLQKKYLKLGAVKIIPPSDWTSLLSFETQLKRLANFKVTLKVQNAKKVEGTTDIFRLTNNPEEEEKTLEVRFFAC